MVEEMKTAWVKYRQRRGTVFQETTEARAHCPEGRSRHLGLYSKSKGDTLGVW